MGTTYVPEAVGSGVQTTTTLNDNFTNIQTALAASLSRDGTAPNSMSADLDMGSNDILNASSVSATSLVLNGTAVSVVGDLVGSDLTGSTVTSSTGTQTIEDALDDRVTEGAVGSESITTDTGTQTVIDALNARAIAGSVGEGWIGDLPAISDMVASSTLVVGDRVRTSGYTTSGDGGGNDYQIVAAGTGTADGGSFIDLTGSGFQAKGLFSDGEYNVLQFGVTGDGTTDDSSAIQACIDFVSAGDTVVFPAPSSSYKISSAISVNKRVHLEGSGAEVTTTAAITMFDLLTEDCSLRGFKLTGDRTANQIAVRIGANYIKVRDLNIGLVDMGIEVWGGVWQRIEHIRGRNVLGTVLRIGNVVGTVVEDFRYDTDTGTYAEPTTGIDLFGEGCNFSDLDFIHAGTALQIRTNARSSTWNFFNSCSFDTSTYGCRIINTDAGESVKGAMFDHCWFSSHSEAGVYINGNFNTDGISLKGCHIVNNDKSGIVIDEASTNVEIIGCTFAGNSVSSSGTYPHIRHSSVGDVSVLTSHFHDWGGLTTVASAAIERTSGGAFIIIGDCFSNSAYNTTGFSDASASPVELGANFGNLPSAAVSGAIPDSTTESTANINITSSDGSFNTIRGEATVQSGVEGTTSAASAFGGVFSNTGGGAGLRVAQGTSEFTGNVQCDNNLAVSGTSTLTGSVAGTGFVNSVDARVNFEVLDAKGDIGTASNQAARGNHTHTKSQITDFAHTHPKTDITGFQNYRMFGTAINTNGSGRATYAHGLGSIPAVIITGILGNGAWQSGPISADATNVTIEVRDITAAGATVNSTAMTAYTIVAVAP
jgi:hypothetical protein